MHTLAPEALTFWLVTVTRLLIIGTLRDPLAIAARVALVTLSPIKHQARKPARCVCPVPELMEGLPLHFKALPYWPVASVAHLASHARAHVIPRSAQ